MRVTLTQDELFEAISDYMRDKMNLDNTASIEISFTAGRSPKGYTADVEITYPKSATAQKFIAKDSTEDAGSIVTSDTVTSADPAVEGITAIPQVDLFGG